MLDEFSVLTLILVNRKIDIDRNVKKQTLVLGLKKLLLIAETTKGHGRPKLEQVCPFFTYSCKTEEDQTLLSKDLKPHHQLVAIFTF